MFNQLIILGQNNYVDAAGYLRISNRCLNCRRGLIPNRNGREPLYSFNLRVKIFDQKNMFDLVVANPPYAKFSENNVRVSKNHNLSRIEILKCINIFRNI